jgi:hypothetical protein
MPVDEQNIRKSKPQRIAPSANECRLEQNVPNPFDDFTEIRFSIPQRELVKLFIFDTRKKVMRRLCEREMQSGDYSIIWNGKFDDGQRAAEGFYIYKLEVGHFVAIRKMEIKRIK